ncbi:MAG TPA: hypothetical protein VIG08_15825 [Gemmatimonadales bacterium]|jgi:hypothetical protein
MACFVLAFDGMTVTSLPHPLDGYAPTDRELARASIGRLSVLNG